MANTGEFAPDDWKMNGLAVLRIVTGLLMAYHGLEVFDSGLMGEYAVRDDIKTLPAPFLMVYIGKGLELVTGILFVLGLLTRIAAVFMAVNMLFICFRIGSGKFYYEDQHPFLFAMLALVFLCTGYVRWGLDQFLFKQKRLTT